jgi:hypothetical protein
MKLKYTPEMTNSGEAIDSALYGCIRKSNKLIVLLPCYTWKMMTSLMKIQRWYTINFQKQIHRYAPVFGDSVIHIVIWIGVYNEAVAPILDIGTKSVSQLNLVLN